MNNLLLILGAILIAVLSALFAVPPIIDWNGYRGVLEEEASRALGRDVRVGGKVDVRLLPTPYVRFEKISVSDVEGITGAPFIEARSFTLWLSVPPLLRGVIEARRVEVDHPDVRIRLNDTGGGNWQTIRFDPRLGGLVPVDVSLQAVQITELQVTVEGADGRELMKFSPISGELSALHMRGPYKFIGTIGSAEHRRDLRLTTSEAGADGRVRLRAQTRSEVDGRSVTIDGDLSDLPTKPAFVGTASYLSLKTGADKKPQRREGSAKLSIDSSRARLTDIALTFEQQGRPQMLAGKATLSWDQGSDLSADLTSRWLDLDRISGLAANAGAIPTLESFMPPSEVLQSLPQSVRLSLAIDQATLGGDVISDAALTLKRENGRLTIESGRAGLPGGTFVHADGEILRRGQSVGFGGQILLEGRSVSRFAGWAGKGLGLTAPARDGRFAFDGALTVSGDLLAISNAKLVIGGDPIELSATQRLGAGNPLLSLTLAAPRLDFSGLAPGALDIDALVTMLRSRGLGGATPGETKFSLTVGEIIDQRETYRDVRIDATLVNGKLSIGTIAARLSDGARIEVAGTLGGPWGGLIGELRGAIATSNPAGAAHLRKVLSHLLPSPLLTSWLDQAPKTNLAFRASLNSGIGPGTTVISLDGSLGSDAVRVDLDSAGPLADWKRHPVELTARITTPDLARTIRSAVTTQSGLKPTNPAQLPLPLTSLTSRQIPAEQRAGTVLVRASGLPEKELQIVARVVSAGLDASYRGLVTVTDTGFGPWSGTAMVSPADAAVVAPLMSTTLGDRIPDVSIGGEIALASTGDTVDVTIAAFKLGNATVSGRLSRTLGSATASTGTVLAGAGSKTSARWSGELTADTIWLPAMVGMIVEPATSARASDGKAEQSDPAVKSGELWTDQPFALGVLDGITASIVVRASTLGLAPGLAATNSQLTFNSSSDGIALTDIQARIAGGRVRGAVNLAAATAGATAKGSIQVTEVQLKDVSAGSPSTQGQASQGQVTGTVTFSGQGLSPRSLLTAASGSGEIAVSGARIGGVSTAAIQRTALAAMGLTAPDQEPPPPPTAQALTEKLMQSLADGRLSIGDRKVTLSLADGVVRFEPIVVQDATGQATNRVTVDLAALAVESEWRLDAKPLGDEAGVLAGRTLPEMTAYFIGPLATVGTQPTRIAAEGLLRELAVLKMERDVRELERLRREDEARAKKEEADRLAAQAEQERLLQEEQARRAAGQVPSLAPGQVPNPAPVGSFVPQVIPAAPGPPAGAAVPLAPPQPSPAVRPGRSGATRSRTAAEPNPWSTRTRPNP